MGYNEKVNIRVKGQVKDDMDKTAIQKIRQLKGHLEILAAEYDLEVEEVYEEDEEDE